MEGALQKILFMRQLKTAERLSLQLKSRNQYFQPSLSSEMHTVGMESIQTPLNFSLFVILQLFAKII